MRERAALPQPPVAVFLVGSQARGWATPSSDFDYIVVSDKPFVPEESRMRGVPLNPSSVAAAVFEPGGPRVEVSYWTTGQFADMVDKVSWEAFERGDVAVDVLTPLEDTVLSRLDTAQAGLGEEWLATTSRTLRDSAFRAFAVRRSLAEADTKLEDLVGLLAIGDLRSAALTARIAFEHTVDAFLDAHHCFGTSTPKWQARRVRDLNHIELPPDHHWSVITMAGVEADARSWIDSTVARCRALSVETDVE